MGRAPANVRQADVERVIRAARKLGAAGVEVRVGKAVMWVNFSPPTQSTAPLASGGDESEDERIIPL